LATTFLIIIASNNLVQVGDLASKNAPEKIFFEHFSAFFHLNFFSKIFLGKHVSLQNK